MSAEEAGKRGVLGRLSGGRWKRAALVAGAVTVGLPIAVLSYRGLRASFPAEDSAPAAAAPAARDTVYEIPELVEVAYDGGLRSGWMDKGWSEREVQGPGPARLILSNLGGWIVQKPGVQGEFGGLALRVKAPTRWGHFLEVRLDSEDDAVFPRVQLGPQHVARREGEWVQLFIPLSELNPNQRAFTRLVLRAHKAVGEEWVELDKLGLTAPGGMRPVTPTQVDPATGEQKPAAPAIEIAELMYEGGLRSGWTDKGWAEREVQGPGPARLRMGNLGGWTLQKPGLPLQGGFAGLTLRYKAPPGYGDFLELRLDSEDASLFPRVKLTAEHVVAREDDGWTQVLVPFTELNPEKRAFTRMILRAHKAVGEGWVELDKVGLTSATPAAAPSAEAVGGNRPTTTTFTGTKLVVDCAARGHRINPMIYGIAFSNLRELKESHQWNLGATARRWGGNPTSRYNWKLGNAWNTANDWYFRNIVLGTDARYTYDTFLETNRERGVKSALTVPLLGWVAKDTSSVSFPVSQFGAQQKTDPDVPEAGNGLSPDGEPLPPPPPTQTSVEAPPEYIAEWVRTIREKDKSRGRSVHMYILDNEPMLWNSTHRDVHPEPATYDELLERTIAYGSVVRREDPDAVIAGPAEWGWTAYHFSAADVVPGGNKKDRKAHGNVPLLPWYLKKLNEHEKQTGVRLLDVVDVHFYPQGKGLGFAEKGETDADASARRIRSTRALWDPKYKDESWIGEPVELIPRLKRWIAENYPGRGISIGEYNFGATTHMSGGLAQAEALGRFAEGNLTSAFFFTYPPNRSPTWWAFRAYRNFDGKGGRFQDNWVPSRLVQGKQAPSLFVSRSDDGKRLVAIALNLEPDAAMDAQVELVGCGKVAGAKQLAYTGDPSGFHERMPPGHDASTVQVQLQPWSINVLDVTLAR
jgi:hypothetical protein